MRGAGDQVPERLGLRNRVWCGIISLFPRYKAGTEDWVSTEIIMAFGLLRCHARYMCQTKDRQIMTVSNGKCAGPSNKKERLLLSVG